MTEQWEALGAQPEPPVHPRARRGEVRPLPGTAAWSVEPNEYESSWRIHAAHRPGLNGYDDAWRVVVQHPSTEIDPTGNQHAGWFHDFDIVVDGQQEAIRVVKWLLAEAEKES